MADKVFPKNFEDFGGIDLRSSDLTKARNFGRRAQNCRFSLSKSLRKRNGYQCVAQAGGFLGGTTYRYLDADDNGATKEEIVAINDNLWRLVQTSFVITRSSSATWSWDVSVSGGEYVFSLDEGSTNILTQSLGTGLEALPYSIAQLRDAIHALANYSCSSIGLRARVNGAQTGVSSITVDNTSSNYVAGDIVTFWDYSTSKLVARTVTSVTATTVVFSSSEGTVNVADDQFLGIAAVPAASIAVNEDNEATGTTSTVYFHYWDWVPFDYVSPLYQSRHPFAEMWSARVVEGFTPPSFANCENILYIATYTTDTSEFDGDAPGRIFKYDGHSVYRAGLPKAYVSNTPAAANVGSLTGTYKYKFRFKQIDKRGRTTYGNLSDEISVTASSNKNIDIAVLHPIFSVPSEHYAVVDGNQATVTTIQVDAPFQIIIGDTVMFWDTVSAAFVSRSVTGVTDNDITISGAAVTVKDNQRIFNKTNERFNGTTFASPTLSPAANTLTAPSGHGFRIGDLISLPNSPGAFLYAGPGGVATRNVTAVTTTTITFDGGAIQLLDNDLQAGISKGLIIEAYRTTAGGSLFYLCKEVPVLYGDDDGSSLIYRDSIIISDTIADATLGVQLEEPPLGFEWDLPPKVRHLAVHQGTLTAAGDITAPNNVYWPDVENIEGWPLASNVATINSAVTGPISAIGSDSDDALIVGKPNAIYALQGEIQPGAIVCKTLTEGDYGLYHASLTKVDGILVGVGDLGVVAIKSGRIIKEVGWPINPRIIKKRSSVALQLALGINDSGSRGFLLYIPDSDAAYVDDAVSFFLDYDRLDSNPTWFDDVYLIGIEPSRGMMMYDNALHFISYAYGGSSYATLSGHLFRQTRLSTLVTKNYWDNHVAIDADLIMAFETLGEPSIDKEFLWLGAYSFYQTEETNLFVANSNSISTYRNFQTTTADTSYTASFTAVTEFEKKQKLNSNKARALAVRVRNNTGGESFHLTGLEMVVALSYLREEMKK